MRSRSRSGAAAGLVTPLAGLAMLVVGLAALVTGLAAPAARAQPPASLEEVLRSNLMGQELETRVPMGPPVTYRESIISRTITRQVVTDIEADGTVSYVMPMMYVPILPKKEIVLSQVSDAIPAGSRVQVSDINLGRKNVVVGLIEQSRGVPTTVRLRLGRKYEESVSAGRMLDLLSRVLVLPRYERLGELDELHADLRSAIGVAERQFAAPGQSNEERLANGKELRAALEEALANRRELAELGGDTSADERRYSGRLAGLAPELAALSEAVGGDRIAAIGAELTEIAGEEDAIAAELAGATPRSSADLERLRARLASWQGLVGRRAELHAELTSLGGELDAVELDRVARSEGRLADARKRLQSADRGVQIGGAVSRLQRLHDQSPGLRADLLTSRTGAGDLDQAEAAMSALGKSIDERRRLVRQLDSLGRKVSDPVLQQIDSDQAELTRFQTLFEAERGSAEVRELDRAYQALEAEFLEIIDTYTLAFGTPQQLPEARRLLTHLRKMEQNRKSASERGSVQAAGELRTVQGQIDDLKKRNPSLR